MNRPKYSFIIPIGFELVRNEFYHYNPEIEFTEELNLFYLQEDLLQIICEKKNLIIDLGWYGDLSSNQGQFKLLQIKSFDWENPIMEIKSKNAGEIYRNLIELLLSVQ